MKRELKRRRITQLSIAKLAGVSRTMVTHWLAGRTKSANLERVILGLLECPQQSEDGAR